MTKSSANLQSPSIILKPQGAASMSEKNSVFLNLSASQESAHEETMTPADKDMGAKSQQISDIEKAR